MRAFEYANPTTKEEAVHLLAGSTGDILPLAGGTDLISLMKDDVVAPGRLVSLKSITEMKGVEWADGSGLRIGAVTSLRELAAHAEVVSRYPSLVQAVDGVRSMQLRGMGTVGGAADQLLRGARRVVRRTAGTWPPWMRPPWPWPSGRSLGPCGRGAGARPIGARKGNDRCRRGNSPPCGSAFSPASPLSVAPPRLPPQCGTAACAPRAARRPDVTSSRQPCMRGTESLTSV